MLGRNWGVILLASAVLRKRVREAIVPTYIFTLCTNPDTGSRPKYSGKPPGLFLFCLEPEAANIAAAGHALVLLNLAIGKGFH